MPWVWEYEDKGGGQGVERVQVWRKDAQRAQTPVVSDDDTVSVSDTSTYESMYEMLIQDLKEFLRESDEPAVERMFNWLAAKGHTGLALSHDRFGDLYYLEDANGSEDSSSEAQRQDTSTGR